MPSAVFIRPGRYPFRYLRFAVRTLVALAPDLVPNLGLEGLLHDQSRRQQHQARPIRRRLQPTSINAQALACLLGAAILFIGMLPGVPATTGSPIS